MHYFLGKWSLLEKSKANINILEAFAVYMGMATLIPDVDVVPPSSCLQVQPFRHASSAGDPPLKLHWHVLMMILERNVANFC